jgi:hypothetical protein
VKGYGVPSGARYHLDNTQTENTFVEQGREFILQDTVRVNVELVSEGSEPNAIMHGVSDCATHDTRAL